MDRRTGRTIDQWIGELKEKDLLDANFAQMMALAAEHGIPSDSQKLLVINLFRSLGKPTPALRSHSEAGTTMRWLDWATTATKGQNQFTITQMMCWMIAASILFAVLRQIGVHPDTWGLLTAALPLLIATGISTILLGLGTLVGQLQLHRWWMIAAGLLLVILSGQWMTSTFALGYELRVLALTLEVGT